MGMEIKVTFMRHENGIICTLEGLSSPVGAVVEDVVPSLWGPLCVSRPPHHLTFHLTRSLLRGSGDREISLPCLDYSESFYVLTQKDFYHSVLIL